MSPSRAGCCRDMGTDTARKGFSWVPGAAQAFVASVLPGRLQGTQVMQEKGVALWTALPWFSLLRPSPVLPAGLSVPLGWHSLLRCMLPGNEYPKGWDAACHHNVLPPLTPTAGMLCPLPRACPPCGAAGLSRHCLPMSAGPDSPDSSPDAVCHCRRQLHAMQL